MFSIEIDDDEIDSYARGHMSFCNGKVTSKNKTPSQKMMIFLSLVQLLDGLSLLLSKKMPAVEFGAIDSSFSVIFSIVKNKNLIQVVYRSKEVGTYPVDHFCEEIYLTIEALLKRLDSGDVIYTDLQSAFTEFNRLR